MKNIARAITFCIIVVLFAGCTTRLNSGNTASKEFHVSLNPNLEFMNSLLLTSKYNEITYPVLGFKLMTEVSNDYTKAIKEYFSQYENAPIYQYIEDMIPNGFTFSRPIEVMFSLEDSTNFNMKYPVSGLCVKYCGGMDKINNLLDLMKGFEDDTQYLKFFEEHRAFYDLRLDALKSWLDEYHCISVLEEEYGIEQNSYNATLSLLMNGSYGISFPSHNDYSTGKNDIFILLSTEDDRPATIFHELSHPFVNPLTEKYSETVQLYADALIRLEEYKSGYVSGYGDWFDCVNEHIARAMSIHLLKKCVLADEANKELQLQMQIGYMYIPKLLESMEYYDNNRNQYKNFEQYYPELLKVFANEI